MVFDPKIPNDSVKNGGAYNSVAGQPTIPGQTTYGIDPESYDLGREDGFEEGRADADYYGANGNGNGNGNGGEPLGLPRGSVRSTLALGLVAALIGITAFLVVADRQLAETALGAFLAMAGSVSTFYFLNRQNGVK